MATMYADDIAILTTIKDSRLQLITYRSQLITYLIERDVGKSKSKVISWCASNYTSTLRKTENFQALLDHTKM